MKKILVVDDSSTMRKIIRRTLRQTGLSFDDVLEAENGVEALSVPRWIPRFVSCRVTSTCRR